MGKVVTGRPWLGFAAAAIAAAAWLSAPESAGAAVIAQHSGDTNPGTEGFTNDGGGPVFGSPVTNDLGLGINAWNMTGSLCCNYNAYSLSVTDLSELQSSNWTVTATIRNLNTASGDGTGIYVVLLYNNVRYDIDLQSDGSGNQILTNLYSGGSEQYTIPNLGTNYTTISMIFSKADDAVNYYVDGTLALSTVSGTSYPYPTSIFFFGGVDGNFNLAQLQTGSAPEPSTWAMMLLGFSGLGFATYRRAASKRAPAI